jgi:hypothetical protein
MGVTPTTPLPKLVRADYIPSKEKILEIWGIANALHTQISSTSVIRDLDENAESKLRYLNHRLQGENRRLKANLEKHGFNNQALKMEITHLESILEECLSHSGYLNVHSLPVLGLATGLSSFYFSDENINSKVAPSVSLYFNPGFLLGTRDYIECWFDYSNPSFNITQNTWNWWGWGWTETITHNTDVMALGASVVLPLWRLFMCKDTPCKYRWNLKGGIGHYWVDDRSPNLNLPKSYWKGLTFKVETEFANLTTRVPFGVFFSWSWLNTPNDLSFPSATAGFYDYGNRWPSHINAGLRFYLFNSYIRSEVRHGK